MGNQLVDIFKEEISEQSREQARQFSLPVIMYLIDKNNGQEKRD